MAHLLATLALLFPATNAFSGPRLDLIKNHLNVGSVSENTGHLLYYGGPVIANAKLIAVYWGPDVAQSTRQGIAGFYAAYSQSGHFDWLSEYDTNIMGQANHQGTNQHLGHGSFAGEHLIMPFNTKTTITNEEIGAELAKQIDAKNLPEPDANTLYLIDFPPGMTITVMDAGKIYTSCKEFCAYHNSAKDSHGRYMYYGVMPDVSDGMCYFGCGGNQNMFDNLTMVTSHEIIEAVTDAQVGDVKGSTAVFPLAWMDPDPTKGEIGDICAQDQDRFTAPNGTVYAIQKEWSNSQNKCRGVQ